MIERRATRQWLRRYPPLAALVVALLVTVLVLPSSLTLPNANPSTVLEYAPVPPQKDDPEPPQTGNVAQFGLGSSSSLSTGISPDIPQVDVPGGKGTKPITKKCVGRPLRQTEDPNSPPCVPAYDGDNGGATWQGVTADEVVVLVYTSLTSLQGGAYLNEDPPPEGSYCDVDGPPNTDQNCLESTQELQDHFEVRITRAFSRYFNERFQTYGRHVHFWVYYSGADTPQERRADAEDNFRRLEPFAVIDDSQFGGFRDIYAEAMTRRNILVFGSLSALPGAYFREFAPFVWSFWPDIEHWADQFTSYVCQKVAPYRTVSHAGAELNGRARRVALMESADPQFPGLSQFADLVKQGIDRCPNGAKLNIVESVSYPYNSYGIDTSPTSQQEAQTNVGRMTFAEATTVLWLGGYETNHTKAAASVRWSPEWIVAGDLVNDQVEEAQLQDQSEWAHAWIASNQLREDRVEDSPCRNAYKEADPNGDVADVACEVYRSFFQAFKSIQVAGPNLSPYSIDQGQHSIQRQSSVDPHTAACYYDPGDYTCVKDMQESWWDPSAPDPNGNEGSSGCWRMVRGGKRYLAGTWEGGDGDVFANPADPCNSTGNNTININTDRPQ